jgi:hypothetical protein
MISVFLFFLFVRVCRKIITRRLIFSNEYYYFVFFTTNNVLKYN